MTMVAVTAGVFGGAMVVRITGLGFALVASPFLVLSLGAFTGVLVCNLLSLLTGIAMLATHWRHVMWRRAVLLLIAAPVVIPLGAVLVRNTPTAQLSVLIGIVLLVAIAAAAKGWAPQRMGGATGTVATGAVSAALNVLAGVGGPALALYGVSQRWTGPTFIATVPVCAVAMNVLSLGFKGLPAVSTGELVIILSAMALGTLGGELLARRLDARHARPALLGIAAVGAIAAIVKGVISW